MLQLLIYTEQMDLIKRRYRPIASQQRQQSITENNQTQQGTSEEPLQIQQVTQYVEDLFQNVISTDFVNDKSKLILFIMVIVVIGFYKFFVGNLRAEGNVHNQPNSRKKQETRISGNKKMNKNHVGTLHSKLNDDQLKNSWLYFNNKIQEKNTTKGLRKKDIIQEIKDRSNKNQQKSKIN